MAVSTSTPEVIEEPKTIPELITYYARLYRVSEWEMTETVRCESRFNPKAWNKSDPYGGAKGIAQFLQPTFDFYSKKAGIINGDIWNVEHSIHTMAYMFSIGEADQWTCWRNLH